MKVLVCGSRDWTDEAAIERDLRKLPPGTIIVHGDCPTGADAIADKVARRLGFEVRPYPADWEGELAATGSSKAAGPKRNAKILREEHPDKAGVPFNFGVAYTKDLRRSRGTKDMHDRARKAGIRMAVVSS